MVSASIIKSDSDNVESIFTKYLNEIDNCESGGFWEGNSCKNLVSKAKEFENKYKQNICEQMSKLAEAVNKLNNYIINKQVQESTTSNLQNATDDVEKSNYQRQLDQVNSEMSSQKTQIEALLNEIVALVINDGGQVNQMGSLISENSGVTTKNVGEQIVEKAKEIHKYMEENNYKYCVYDGNDYEEHNSNQKHGLNTTFEESKNGFHNTCCATYVSWVLQESGLISREDHSNSANTLAKNLKEKGWTKVDKPQPGDVMVFNHHVQIYGDDGKIYNAGSGSSIRKAPSESSGKMNYSYCLRAPEK